MMNKCFMDHRKTKWTLLIFGILIINVKAKRTPDFADFDDTVIYKIDFEYPDFEIEPQYKNINLVAPKVVYTSDMEKYVCMVPNIDFHKEVKDSNEAELSPLTLLQPIFATGSCSFRMEAYWSYEICHGLHVRQYHEEREGKSIKFQEFFLGKWSEEKTEKLAKTWEEERKAGAKYKSVKIDNVRYPYYEMEFTDGTVCDIINAPRTTFVRYVCYPHGKNEIYSFKETSSCQYEAIVLTSVLCLIPAFHPEKTKELSIKCMSNEVKLNQKNHKPLSLLRQEAADDDDFPISKNNAHKDVAYMLRVPGQADSYIMMSKVPADVDKLLESKKSDFKSKSSSSSSRDSSSSISSTSEAPKVDTKITDISPLLEFISGKNCLTGGTGWWKYEFCYGRHVRQFHKDKKLDVELFLGFFSEMSHRQWAALNPEKFTKYNDLKTSLWHHYEKGTRCDRTGKPREVDVKLTCVPITNSAVTLSMYLLEPKTCQYILVVESSIICDLIHLADDYDLVKNEELEILLKQIRLLNQESGVNDKPNDANTKTNTVTETVQPTVELPDIFA